MRGKNDGRIMVEKLTQALDNVGKQWKKGVEFPSWVDLEECSLDQFYTRPQTASDCLTRLCRFLDERGIQEKDCLFVEPSAGSGSFADLLPANSILLDIDPKDERITQCDFLTWDADADMRIREACESGKKTIAIGNPPFGTRGWMALAFLNKCAEFCDYCAFLLPMSFASEGKGSPRYRVNGMRSVHIDELQRETFLLPDGTERKFNVIWQIWEKGENRRPTFEKVDELFVIKTIGDFSYRLCGQEFKKEADIFVSQAFYPNAGMKISKDWDDILYGSGYGVKAKDPRDADEMIRVLSEADWSRFSTSATHGCRHVGITEIKKVLSEAF